MVISDPCLGGWCLLTSDDKTEGGIVLPPLALLIFFSGWIAYIKVLPGE